MLLKARFDCVGKFTDMEGKEHDAKTAHYTITSDEVSGGLYLPIGMEFPAGGITIHLAKGGDAKK